MAQDPMMATAIRLSTSVDALAALAAHARVHGEGLEVDPEVRRLLDEVVAELVGESNPTAAPPPVVGLVTTLLGLGADLVRHPDRAAAWEHTDPALLNGIGRLSGAIAGAVDVASPQLDGLADALARDGATFLDVGTGTGWLAIAMARAFPALRVTGVDLFDVPLDLARANVAAERLDDRVELRLVDVLEMEDAATYDAIWLPMPFLPEAVVHDVLGAAKRMLVPGGWLLPGTFAGPDDRLSELLVDLRTVRSGGRSWRPDEMVALLSDAGFAEACEVDRSWPAPVRLFAGRRA